MEPVRQGRGTMPRGGGLRVTRSADERRGLGSILGGDPFHSARARILVGVRRFSGPPYYWPWAGIHVNCGSPQVYDPEVEWHPALPRPPIEQAANWRRLFVRVICVSPLARAPPVGQTNLLQLSSSFAHTQIVTRQFIAGSPPPPRGARG